MRTKRVMVTTKSEFPMDMLRYDRCWPATDLDATAIATSFCEGQGPAAYSVVVETDETTRWHEGRWASFGCKIEPVGFTIPSRGPGGAHSQTKAGGILYRAILEVDRRPFELVLRDEGIAALCRRTGATVGGRVVRIGGAVTVAHLARGFRPMRAVSVSGGGVKVLEYVARGIERPADKEGSV